MDKRNHREKKLEEKHFSMGQNVKKTGIVCHTGFLSEARFTAKCSGRISILSASDKKTSEKI